MLGSAPQPLDSSSLDGLGLYPSACTQVLVPLRIMGRLGAGSFEATLGRERPRETILNYTAALPEDCAKYCTFPCSTARPRISGLTNGGGGRLGWGRSQLFPLRFFVAQVVVNRGRNH